jgi:mannonate dehydratase
MQLADYFLAQPDRQWELAKQMGVTHAVCRLPEDEGIDPADFVLLRQIKERFTQAGLKLAVIEPVPNKYYYRTKLGLDGRDEEIEMISQLIRNMGRLGIEILCCNFMAQIGWFRTSTMISTRGGALVTGFDYEAVREAPFTEAGLVPPERIWRNFQYFLKAVLPVAEAAGVKLALHPDDPPIPNLRGIGRVLISFEAMKRAMELYSSKNLGITLCQGTFAAMGEQIPAVIRYFGSRQKLFFVHFRDVEGSAVKFNETFHDAGKTDMAEAIRAYREVGYHGPGAGRPRANHGRGSERSPRVWTVGTVICDRVSERVAGRSGVLRECCILNRSIFACKEYLSHGDTALKEEFLSPIRTSS